MNDIQRTILDIFKQVALICERHDIPYYAIGGTCIGAVRHTGFIPWDDDLDIAIPIQHFDRFWEVAAQELPNPLQIYTSRTVKHYRYIFGKVHNAATTFIEESELAYSDAYKGIFVDIMPISSVPDDEAERSRFYKGILRCARLNYIRRYPLKGMDTVKKKLMWLLMRPMCLFTTPDYYSQKWLDILRRVPFGSTALTGYTWSLRIEQLTFPMEDFQNSVELPFEDTTMKCPAGYHDYLTAQFGDYRKLPPEDQRRPHFTETVDVNTPYAAYRRKKTGAVMDPRQ